MLVPISENYQKLEISIKETKKPEKACVTLGGRMYKILGSAPDVTFLKSHISTLQSSSFSTFHEFKTSLEGVIGNSKVKLVGKVILGNEIESKSLKQEINEFLEKKVKEMNFRGVVLVIKDGKEILKQGYGDDKLTSQTTFQIASISKSFTAAMILKLQQEDVLSIEDPINKLLPPKFQDKKWEEVTIKHLLNHTSGIPTFQPDEGEQKQYTVDELIYEFKDKELDFTPGSKVKYCNSSYAILGAIIEKIYDAPFAECIKKQILDKFDMESTGFGDTYNKKTAAHGYEQILNKNGEVTLKAIENQGSYLSKAYAGGALYSNLDDLQKFDAALYNDDFLTPATRKLMFTPAEDLPGIYDPFEKMGFGFKIWIDKDLGPVVSKEGNIPGFDTIIQRYLNSKSCIVVLSNNGSLNAERDIGLKIEEMFRRKDES